MAVERIDVLRTEIIPDQFKEYKPTSELEEKGSIISKTAHAGMFRMSGEPYWTHCSAVAAILDSWGVREIGKTAAWVHDTLEDCPSITYQYLQQELGPEVAFIVNGVSKFVLENGEQGADTKTHKKMLDSQEIDIRVSLVKLADRVHNMSTLSSMSPEKKLEKSRETLEIYAPLAEALGLWDIKNYLEDISFMYVDPERYSQIKKQIDSDPRLNSAFLSQFTSHVSQVMEKSGIKSKVNVHVGGYWSLYQKREQLAAKGLCDPDNFLGVSDVVSVRVLTEDVSSCYIAIGQIHESMGKFVDYSKYDQYLGANKRDNGYEALQTTLNLADLGNIEIAVTTEEKEQFNRWGVIQKMKDGSDLHEFQLKSAILITGDRESVHFVPFEGTLIDIAYDVNEVTGASLDEVLVDGKKLPLDTIFKNASTLEFVLGQNRRAPSKTIIDAMDKVLPRTRRKIQDQLNMKRHDELVRSGEQCMEQILAPRGLLALSDLGDTKQRLINDLQLPSETDLYYYLGSSGSYSSKVIEWLNRNEITKEKTGFSTLRIAGVDQRGIMSEVTTLITSHDGNIRHLALDTPNGSFKLRIAVNGLDKTAEDFIHQLLLKSNKYTSVELV